MKRILFPMASMALFAATTPALAHAGIGDSHGFAHGFSHPIGGVDHILAMVTVGLFAAHLGGRALWFVPATFVASMALGGALGMDGIAVPYVEAGIGLSVLVLGLALALRISPPVGAAMGLVGFFALFHGHAHGAEMPVDASGVAYALGFVTATAALHAFGVSLGLAIDAAGTRVSARTARVGGAAIALAGVGLLAGWV